MIVVSGGLSSWPGMIVHSYSAGSISTIWPSGSIAEIRKRCSPTARFV
jgi:hypothetical protein